MRNFTKHLTKNYKYLRHTPKGILLLSILLIGIIMRAPTSVYGPIVELLQSDFQINSATVGLLTGVPVCCYALFSPFASWVIGKKGLEFGFTVCVVFCTIGMILRPIGGFGLMLFATVIIGLGVAFGNIGLPLIAARDFPKKFSIVTGIASSTMNLGVVFALSITAPIAYASSWRISLDVWILACLLALFIWCLYLARKSRGGSRKLLRSQGEKPTKTNNTRLKALFQAEIEAGVSSSQAQAETPENGSKIVKNATTKGIWRRSFTYLVALLFICQCFCYFSFTSWLPQILVSQGMDIGSSGAASSILQLLGVAGSITVAFMIKPLGHTKTFIIVAICWLTVPFGLLFLPHIWWLWLIFGGWAQSANYILMFAAITQYAPTQNIARKLSTTTQTSAYAIAGLSPSIIGAVHDTVNGWTIPLYILGVALIIMLFSGIVSYSQIKNAHT